MDKKVYLLDKSYYWVPPTINLTEKDVENLIADVDYNDNKAIVKIDANGYDSAKDAIMNEMPSVDLADYYMFAFGF